MAGDIKTALTSRASTTTLAADPDLFAASVAATTKFVADIGLRVSAADGNGGFRFNVRLPAAAAGFVFKPWQVSILDGHMAPVLALPEKGIGLNVGATPQDYFLLDYGGAAFDVVVSGTIVFRTGATVGNVSVEWCQHRSNAIATVLGAGSGFTARNP